MDMSALPDPNLITKSVEVILALGTLAVIVFLIIMWRKDL